MDSTILVKDIRHGMKNLTLTVIVLDVGNPVPVKDNREVRTVKVADGTACINLSLWDEPGQLLMPGDIVRLTKGYASIWRNCLTLYSGKNGDIDKVGEFSMVFNEQLNMSEPNLTFDNPPGPMQQMPVNNGSLNNGNRPMMMGQRPPGPPNLTMQPGPPKGAGPRFPPESQQQQGKHPNKMNNANSNNKSGRGGLKSNLIRTERR